LASIEERVRTIERTYAHLLQDILVLRLTEETLRLVLVLKDGMTLRVTERWMAHKLVRYSIVMKEQLLSKIENHTAQVAIIGLGYVGLPLAVAFAEAGFPVIGIDVDQSKVDAISAGHRYISDIPTGKLKGIAFVDKVLYTFALA